MGYYTNSSYDGNSFMATLERLWDEKQKELPQKEQKDFNHRNLSEAIHVSHSKVSKWSGSVSPSTEDLLALSDYFDVSIEELLELKKEKAEKDILDIFEELFIYDLSHSYNHIEFGTLAKPYDKYGRNPHTRDKRYYGVVTFYRDSGDLGKGIYDYYGLIEEYKKIRGGSSHYKEAENITAIKKLIEKYKQTY